MVIPPLLGRRDATAAAVRVDVRFGCFFSVRGGGNGECGGG